MESSLTILCYHRILPDADRHGAGKPYFLRGTAVSETNFAAQIRSVVEHFDILTESDVLDWLDGKREFGRRSCWITFDDGYQDVIERAAPILLRHQLPATMFVTTGVMADPGRWLPADSWYATLGGAMRDRGSLTSDGTRWDFDLSVSEDYARLVDGPDRRRYLCASPPEQAALLKNLAQTLDAAPLGPADLYASPVDLRKLVEADWSIGGHGHDHRILTRVSVSERVLECRATRRFLEATGFSPRTLAYPDGACDRDICDMARAEGWSAAVTLGNSNAIMSDRYALSRFVACDEPTWIEDTVI